MLNTNPIETVEEEGFEACRRAVSRYIRKHVHSAEAEDLIQETYLRIWKNMQTKESVPHEGHCILTAKNVVREHWRKAREHQPLDEIEEQKLPGDGGQDFDNRGKLSGCQADCFENIDEADKVLLWRYSFKEEYELFDDETYSSSTYFFQSLLPVVEKIKRMFLPVQNKHAPLSGEEKKNARLQVFRLRRYLIQCLKECLKEYSQPI